MIIRKFCLLIVLFSTTFLWSQTSTVAGEIKDQMNLPIAYANILLLKAQDSTIVTGTTSDDNGTFSIENITPDSYLLKVSFIGYKESFTNFTIDKDIQLETIILEETAEALAEIEILVKRPTFKREIDRLVFNVESTALSEGNMLEVLRSTPGVLIIDNSILVKNTLPTVYINDRKVHLSANEVIELLEGTSASNIKSVEVITNPPARYDAESGVVLNIVMAKNLITGYSGSVFSNYTQGVFPKTNHGMSSFFKNSKVSLFANYSYNNKKVDRVNREKVNYPDQLWHSDIDRNTWSETHTISLNVDFNLNDNNILSLSANTQFLPYFKYVTKNRTLISDNQNTLLSWYDANNLSRDNKHNLGFDLDYVHTFKKDKARLSFNTHYTNYDYRRNQRVNSNYFLADNTFVTNNTFNTKANQGTQIITSQLDYTLPINESSSFETGVKVSNIKTDSGIVQNDIIGGQEVPNLANTDAFDYNEDVYAAYLSYQNSGEKWSFSSGLRLEQTKIEGLSILNSNFDKQDYLELFPTANISFQASEKVNAYTSYKRSIERPDYNNLNPFKFFVDDNTVVTGNPDLKPVFIDHFVLGTTLGDHWTIEAYYKTDKNNIFEIPLQDNNTNVVSYTPVNIDRTEEFGFDFITYFDMTKNWSVYFLTSFYHISDNANFSNTSVEQSKWSNYTDLSNNFTFLKDRSLTANLMFIYLSDNIQGLQYVDKRVYSEISLRKTMLKGKGILSLTISDFFNDHDFMVTTKFLDQSSSIFTNDDNRYIKLGFRYKFGNTKLSTNERSLTAEERDRLN